MESIDDAVHSNSSTVNVRASHGAYPWMNQYLRSLVREKNRLYKHYRKNRNEFAALRLKMAGDEAQKMYDYYTNGNIMLIYLGDAPLGKPGKILIHCWVGHMGNRTLLEFW